MMHGTASNPTGTVEGWLLEQVRSVPYIAEELGAEEALNTIEYLREYVQRMAAGRQLTTNQTLQLLVRLASYEARIITMGASLFGEPARARIALLN